MTGTARPALVRVGAGPAVGDLLSRRATEVLAVASVVVVDGGLEPLAHQLAPSARILLAEGLAWSTLPAEGVVRLVPGDGVAQPPGEPAATDVVPALAATAEAAALATLASAGDVAAARPLAGLTVAVTRAADQADEFAALLWRRGAAVVSLPTIAIELPHDGGAGLSAALALPQRYAWVVVTSANGARRVLDRVPDGRALAGVKLAAIGPATAAVLAAAHLPPDLVPPSFVAESLLEVFPAPPHPGARVLLARAEVARDVLPAGLAAAGWRVDVVPAYRTVAAQPDAAQLAAAGGADVVCFTSPSTFERFVELAGRDRLAPVVASIGPVTSAAIRNAGVAVTVEAAVHTVAGLVAALVAWATQRSATASSG